jgi:hypothetical protein
MPITTGNKKELTQARREGPTPNGGAYSIAYFLDANWKPVPRERAEVIEVIEFTQEDTFLKSTILRRPKNATTA